MHNALLGFILASVGGCICGGFEGGGNRVYERNGAEMLILCENGGFVATLASNMLEGRYADSVGTLGETGELAFDFVRNANGNFSLVFAIALIHLPDVKVDYNQTSFVE